MANLQITSTQANNIVVTVNRGISGVGIESISIVYEDPLYYLDFLYTDGTNELVELPAISAGVTSFNTRIGAITLTSADVTTALGYTPPTPSGTGATGTWTISINGNALTVTNGVYTTDTGTVTNTMLAGSIANDKLVNSAITVNGTSTSLGGSVNVGTVTSVGGTGTVNGISLSGTVSSTGNLTLGGALSGVNLTSQVTGTLPLANGGTNATTAPDARTNLGLGTSAVLNSAVALGTATLDAGGTVPLSQIPASIQGGLNYQGTWNASTNTPTLTSSVGSKGYYYAVSVAGSTNLNGITDWNIGDLATYSGTAWQKIDNTDAVTSVNGFTGSVVLSTTNVAEGTNEYFTTARARSSVSAGTGISYASGTGVMTNSAPDQTVALTAGTGITTSGTYPNFTITNSLPSLGGNVVGAASSTDNAVARYDGTTGKLIQNSTVTIGDDGSITTLGNITENGYQIVSQSDIGTAPNEIPLNQYLGSLAYQSSESVTIDGGVATLESATITSIQNDTAISNVEPSLMLNFAQVKKLDPRITYARASTGAYYDGKTVSLAEQNLLTYSQEFDNAAWNKTNNVTVTANATLAPDGTTTADLLFETAVSGIHILSPTSGIPGTSKISTFMVSIFAKKGSGATAPDWVQIALGGSVNGYANFNLSTGASGNSSNCTSSIISNVDGWYRLVVQVNTLGASGLAAYVAFTNNTDATSRYPSYAGLTTSNVFIWGVQAEERSSVTAYTPTTTQPITNYIPTLLTAHSNVARFDHDPLTSESLGLLIEEQRTNLFLQSETFGSSWSKTRCSITANTVVAPDGTLTGNKLVEDTTASNSHVAGQVGGITGVVSALSVYAKAAERQFIAILHGGTSIFDLSNGVVSLVGAGTTPSITDVGDGWYRCTVVGTAPSTSYIGTALTGTSYLYTGDGYSGIFIWGAQLEAGSFPTSYIPTVASQVTRSADSASMTGANFSSWYRADQFTMYIEAKGDGARMIGINDGTGSNRVELLGASVTAFGNTNGSTLLSIATGVSLSTDYSKSALSVKTNDVGLCVNAGTVLTDTSYLMPVVDRMTIGCWYNLTGQLNGTIKKISYYPQRLSNEELQEMTS